MNARTQKLRMGGLTTSAIALLLAGAPDLARAQSGPAFETTEIADGVYRFRWQAHVGMFVVGSNGVAAFDPINAEAAATYAREIKRVAGDLPLKWIVYSHSDADHASGGNVLRDAFGGDVPIVATAASVDEIAARDSDQQPLPDVTFDTFMSLDLGGKAVELHFFGPSHSDNLLVGYVPGARVAFGVDFVNNDRVGYQTLPGWHFPQQNRTIKATMDLGFETMIFGHGDPGDRETMWRQARYYDALEGAVRAAIAEGWTEDQTAERVMLEEFRSFGGWDNWRELNVRGAYRILSGS